MRGDFKRAGVFFKMISGDSKFPADTRAWGTILENYTNCIEAQFNAGCLKSPLALSSMQYTSKQDLAEACIAAQRAMRQLIIIKSQANEKISFAELHKKSWLEHLKLNSLFDK